MRIPFTGAAAWSRAATLMGSPIATHSSSRRSPTAPITTSPVLTPTRMASSGPPSLSRARLRSASEPTMSRAASTARSGSSS